MLVQIFQNVANAKYSHKVVFVGLAADLHTKGIGQLTAVQTGSVNAPAIGMTFRKPPPTGTQINVPISITPNRYDAHPALNTKLVMDGLRAALAQFGPTRVEACANGQGSEVAIRVNLV